MKVLKEKNCQSRILYSGKLSFGHEKKKSFFSPTKTKTEAFYNTMPTLQEMLKGVLKLKWIDMKTYKSKPHTGKGKYKPDVENLKIYKRIMS